MWCEPCIEVSYVQLRDPPRRYQTLPHHPAPLLLWLLYAQGTQRLAQETQRHACRLSAGLRNTLVFTPKFIFEISPQSLTSFLSFLLSSLLFLFFNSTINDRLHPSQQIMDSIRIQSIRQPVVCLSNNYLHNHKEEKEKQEV